MVMGRQGAANRSALTIFRTLEGLVIGFFSGFSNAASVLVGKSVGAGELGAAYERAKRLVLLCGCSIFVLCGVLLLVHQPLLSVMSLSGPVSYTHLIPMYQELFEQVRQVGVSVGRTV